MNSKNSTNIVSIFQESSPLSILFDKYECNIKNISNINGLFYKCPNLTSYPGISILKTTKAIYGL